MIRYPLQFCSSFIAILLTGCLLPSAVSVAQSQPQALKNESQDPYFNPKVQNQTDKAAKAATEPIQRVAKSIDKLQVSGPETRVAKNTTPILPAPTNDFVVPESQQTRPSDSIIRETPRTVQNRSYSSFLATPNAAAQKAQEPVAVTIAPPSSDVISTDALESAINQSVGAQHQPIEQLENLTTAPPRENFPYTTAANRSRSNSPRTTARSTKAKSNTTSGGFISNQFVQRKSGFSVSPAIQTPESISNGNDQKDIAIEANSNMINDQLPEIENVEAPFLDSSSFNSQSTALNNRHYELQNEAPTYERPRWRTEEEGALAISDNNVTNEPSQDGHFDEALTAPSQRFTSASEEPLRKPTYDDFELPSMAAETEPVVVQNEKPLTRPILTKQPTTEFSRQDNNLQTQNDFSPDNFSVSEQSNESEFQIQTPQPKRNVLSSATSSQTQSNVATTQEPQVNLSRQPAENQAAPIETESFEPGRVLALVGGEPIFAGDLMLEVNQRIHKAMPGATEAQKKQYRPLLLKNLLPQFVSSKLLYLDTINGLPEKADLGKILEQVKDAFDENALEKLMEQYGVSSPTEFDAHLRMLGSSLRKHREAWSKEQLTRSFLGERLNVDTDVTHQEMLDYYRKHLSDYEFPAKAKWEQVVATVAKHGSRKAAKQAIVQIGNEIVYGAKLSAVAKKRSNGYNAFNGGQHDWTSKGALVLKEIDKAIFELPVGELSELIETRDGFHIVRVIERKDAGRTPFLEAQVEIKQKLIDQKREAVFQDHLAKLRKQIPVEIYDFEVKDPRVGQTFTLKR